MRRIRVQEILSHATFVVVMCAIGIFAMNITGCGEEVENPVEAEGAIDTLKNIAPNRHRWAEKWLPK